MQFHFWWTETFAASAPVALLFAILAAVLGYRIWGKLGAFLSAVGAAVLGYVWGLLMLPTIGYSTLLVLSIPWAVVPSLLVAGMVWRFKSRKLALGTFFLGIFLGFTINQQVLYWFCPSMVGAFWGMLPMILLAILNVAILALVHFGTVFAGKEAESDRNYGGYVWRVGHPIMAGAGVSGFLVLFALLGIYTYYSWGTWPSSTDTPAEWGELAKIEVAKEDETLPPTDADHMILVTADNAHNRGQMELTQSNDPKFQNLGSLCKVEKSNWALQAVREKMTYMCPLSFGNGWNQLYYDSTPGFVSVDAEHPNEKGGVTVHTDHPIRFMPDAMWERNLHRHLYLNGYIYGDLDGATFEVDDDLHPFYTVTYTRPKFVIGGPVIHKILLVDASSGNVEEYTEDNLPKWVDRVRSRDLVLKYAQLWGKYEKVKENGWPNWGHVGQMKPIAEKGEQIEMLYSSAHRPVYVVEMTSNTNTDTACTGVLVFDSNKNHGRFLPGLRAISVGKNVKDAFEGCAKNFRHYTAGSVQLYHIYGFPTWVCVYVRQSEHGEQFAALGMMPANTQPDPTKVAFSATKATVLAEYASVLANQQGGDSKVSQQNLGFKTVTGTVTRIGQTLEDLVPVWFVEIESDGHLFRANRDVFNRLPTTQVGDRVEITFIDTKTDEVPVKTLKRLPAVEAKKQ